MLVLGLVFGALFGAVVWDYVKQSPWFPWESKKVKELRLERDGYKNRLDDVVVALDAEKDALAMLAGRNWEVKRDSRDKRWSGYMSLGMTSDTSSPFGWRVNDQWHKTLVGAYRKAIIAYDADVKLREELGKVE